MSNGANITDITRNVEDALTFPILTKEVDGNGGGGADLTRTGVSGGTSLGRLARDTIRGVLGWRYRTDDVKGFTAALTKSFQLREVEGHVEWDFKPQSYMIQADLGEITGAQASIYTRAKVALDQSLPLLDGLRPLRPDVDNEDVQAMRAIVRTELSELVQEFGMVGGPRVQRGDSIFGLLLGDEPDSHYNEPENVEGQLGELRDRLGLERRRVNTIEEEQNFTNFLILVDYTNSLHQTWISQRGFFVRNSNDPFLGTELVLLSQLLEVIAESVRDAQTAMDSVNFGVAERQTTELLLTLDDRAHPMTVAELLGWVENFATVEGRQLLQDGGKDGVVVFRFTLSRLLRLVNQAFEISRQPAGNPTRGFHTARVRAALEEIKLHLTTALGRANKLDRSQIRYVEEDKPDDQKFPPGPLPPPPNPGPVIFEISPNTGEPGDRLDATIKGGHFRNAGVHLGDKIAVTITSQTANEILVSLVIAGDAKPGGRNLTITNGDDGSWAELLAFTVVSPDRDEDTRPTITRIFPPELSQEGERIGARVEGTNLPSGAAVNLGEDVYFYPTEWTPDAISGTLKVGVQAPPGKRNLSVFYDGDYDGEPNAVLPNAFEVKAKKPCEPELEKIEPNFGLAGQSQTAIVTGKNLLLGAEVKLSEDVIFEAKQYACGTSITGTIRIDDDATIGPRTLSVKQHGVKVLLPNAFEVKAKKPCEPELEKIEPNFGLAGQSQTAIVTGKNLLLGAKVTLSEDVIFEAKQYACDKSITGTIGIDDDATIGPRTLSVEQYGVKVLLPNAFEVKAKKPCEPELEKMEPNFGLAGQSQTATITGKNLLLGAEVKLSEDVIFEAKQYACGTSITGTMRIDDDATIGPRTLSVKQYGVKVLLPNAFEVKAKKPCEPELEKIEPNFGLAGQSQTATITGKNLLLGAEVKLSEDVIFEAKQYACDTSITGTIRIDDDATIGPRTLSVEQYGVKVLLPNAFEVKAKKPCEPELEKIEPNFGLAGQSQTAIVTGKNLLLGAEVKLSEDVIFEAKQYACDKSITGTIRIDDDATIGPRTLSVEQYGVTVLLPNAFEVKAKEPCEPELEKIEPNFGLAGQSQTATVTGKNLLLGAKVKLSEDVIFEAKQYACDKSITGTIRIDDDATIGPRTLSVEQYGVKVLLPNAFEVKAKKPCEPELEKIEPNFGLAGQSQTATITGKNLLLGAEVKLSEDVIFEAKQYACGTSITGTIRIDDDATIGPRTLSVKQHGVKVLLPNAFEVKAKKPCEPELEKIEPNFGLAGRSQTATVTGKNLLLGAKVTLSEDVIFEAKQYACGKSITGTIRIDDDATIGPRTLSVEQYGVKVLLPNAFEVKAKEPCESKESPHVSAPPEEQKSKEEVASEQQVAAPPGEQKSKEEVVLGQEAAAPPEEQKSKEEVVSQQAAAPPEEQKSKDEVVSEQQVAAPPGEQKSKDEVVLGQEAAVPLEEQKTKEEVVSGQQAAAPPEEQKSKDEEVSGQQAAVPPEEQKSKEAVASEQQVAAPVARKKRREAVVPKVRADDLRSKHKNKK